MKKFIPSILLLSLAIPTLAQKPDPKPTPKPEPPKEITGKQINDLARFMLRGPIKKAQVTSARMTMSNLVTSIDSFYEEYQALPLGSTQTIDGTVTTVGKKGSPLMAALIGLQSAQEENPKRQAFFEAKEAKERKDGIHRAKNTADLYDPWGNGYQVLLNYDYNDNLRCPITNEVLYERRTLVWSHGPDGKSGTPETNKDNVYSWHVAPPK